MSRTRLPTMTSASCRPTRLKAMIERAIRTTRNSVPQRWVRGRVLRTSAVVSGLPASRAWIVMCSAPWYWKTRRMSGVREIRAR